MVENQFESKVKIIQSNNGIEHHIYIPNTAEQNDIIERKHQHMIHLTMCILSKARLPLS